MCSVGIVFKIVQYLWYVLKSSVSEMHLTHIENESTKRLHGKTVIVTGANSGIGKETVLDLAGRGALVIMACRNLKEAGKAMKEIVEKTGNKNIVAKLFKICPVFRRRYQIQRKLTGYFNQKRWGF